MKKLHVIKAFQLTPPAPIYFPELPLSSQLKKTLQKSMTRWMFPDIQELSYKDVSEFCLLIRVRVLSQINSFIHKYI